MTLTPPYSIHLIAYHSQILDVEYTYIWKLMLHVSNHRLIICIMHVMISSDDHCYDRVLQT